MTGTPRFSPGDLAGTRAPWSHRLRSSHGSWACAGMHAPRPPKSAGFSDTGPPGNHRASVSCSLFLLPMGQDVPSPILRSSCPSESMTGLSRIESTAWTSRGHHKSGPHPHGTVTNGEMEHRYGPSFHLKSAVGTR